MGMDIMAGPAEAAASGSRLGRGVAPSLSTLGLLLSRLNRKVQRKCGGEGGTAEHQHWRGGRTEVDTAPAGEGEVNAGGGLQWVNWALLSRGFGTVDCAQWGC